MTMDHDIDPFEGYQPLAGVEHLGRAIVDADGMPSGSPANYEALRGSTGRPQMTAEDKAAAVAAAVAHISEISSGYVGSGETVNDDAQGEPPVEPPTA